MGITRLPTALFFSFIFLIVSSSLFVHIIKPQRIGATSPNVVISEIQISGDTSTDEFVELYNPTTAVVSVDGWRLTKKTGTGSEYILVSTLSGSIQPHRYFLIAHTDYNDATIAADRIFDTNTVSAHNTIFLYNDEGITVIDKVGMGSGAIEEERSHTSIPDDNRSVERKANASSTKMTMESGGVDEFAGNTYDSDNNSADFVYRTFSDPQNSNSAEEPPISPTSTPTIEPTATPTEEPTPTPTEELTPTPTEEIASTPTPIAEFTPTPTEEPTPTPTEEIIPTPTLEPTPTATPTLQPTPTPTPQIFREIVFPGMTLRCYIKPLAIHSGWLSLSIPRLSCTTY